MAYGRRSRYGRRRMGRSRFTRGRGFSTPWSRRRMRRRGRRMGVRPMRIGWRM